MRIRNGRGAALGLVALLLTALPAAPQTPAPPSIADVSRTVEAATRNVMPAVVEIFTTSYTPREGIVPRTAISSPPSAPRAQASLSILTATSSPTRTWCGARSGCASKSRSRRTASRFWRAAAGRRTAGRRHRSRDRSRGHQGRSEESAGAGVRRLGRVCGGPIGACHRQPAWPQKHGVIRRRRRGGAAARARVSDDLRADRRHDQSGQQRRAARRPARPRRRHQHAHLLADRRLRRARICGAEQHRADDLRADAKSGRVRRGDIGVRAQTVTPVLATGLNLARDRGVVLADVLPGGPAARAGLRAGDLVLPFDGKSMENGRQFQVTPLPRCRRRGRDAGHPTRHRGAAFPGGDRRACRP